MTVTVGKKVPVRAYNSWKSNADLFKDVAQLGYIKDTNSVLDATYGLGNFWSKYRPKKLVGCDLNPDKAPDFVADFRNLPFADCSFDVVVYDPDFRMNGKPDRGDFDSRYGVDVQKDWKDRLKSIVAGAEECARVADKYLLCKVMDQVVSGKVCWMTDDVSDAVKALGFYKKDRFDMVTNMRAQPPGRGQVHARRNGSTLLVFKRL